MTHLVCHTSEQNHRGLFQNFLNALTLLKSQARQYKLHRGKHVEIETTQRPAPSIRILNPKSKQPEVCQPYKR